MLTLRRVDATSIRHAGRRQCLGKTCWGRGLVLKIFFLGGKKSNRSTGHGTGKEGIHKRGNEGGDCLYAWGKLSSVTDRVPRRTGYSGGENRSQRGEGGGGGWKEGWPSANRKCSEGSSERFKTRHPKTFGGGGLTSQGKGKTPRALPAGYSADPWKFAGSMDQRSLEPGGVRL